MPIELPNELDQKFKKDKTDTTYNTYMFMISKLFKEALNTETFSLNELKKKDTIKDYIESLSLTTKKLTTIAIVMLLKAAKYDKTLIDYYGKMARRYRIEDKKLRKFRAATEDEMVYHVNWQYLKELKKEYKNFLNSVNKHSLHDITYKRLFMGYLVFELLTSVPPQRGEALFNCYIDRDVKGSNIIDTKKKQWIIRASKTKKSFGERIIPLSNELISLIKEWETMSNCLDKLLICNDKGQKMSTQSYTQYLNNTVFRTGASRQISTDDLRKAYVTHMIVHEGTNTKMRDTMANLLGHSPTTMMELYFKPNLEENISFGGKKIC